MVPQIAAVANGFGVRVIGSGGFSSLTCHHAAAVRLSEIAREKAVAILLIGDYDPSGQSIIDSSCEDIVAFMDKLNPAHHLEFTRLAVTPEQAEEYGLESKPQKATDKRGEHMPETYQAEALDPDVLSQIVREKLLELIPATVLARARKAGERDRKLLSSWLKLAPKGRSSRSLAPMRLREWRSSKTCFWQGCKSCGLSRPN
jgi:hypothetical protein